MNDGKICVSVCAETADEFVENIRRAEQYADVIELRFDCLQNSEVEKALTKLEKLQLDSAKILLATFRQPEQGGKKKLMSNYHIEFWLNSKIDKIAHWADFEFDLDVSNFNLNFQREIRSGHWFSRKIFIHSPEFLNVFFEKLKNVYAGSIFKLAAQADDIADTIEIWSLLKKAKKSNEQIIPVAMGEAGKWTRILGLAHGAFMTYASLETGKETASGQISGEDLIELYRVKELDEQTDVYGILGNPVSHSLSPYIHNNAFKFHKLNAVFIPFEVRNLDEFIAKFVRPETREVELNFKGFSVTIPHKQAIIRHLDFIDETAKAIGAVNTVKIIDGKLHGFNTDADGFIEPLKTAYGDLKTARVAVLGSGGAARACVYALKREFAEITVFARNLETAENLAEEFGIEIRRFPTPENQRLKTDFDDFDILINATPLGTKGKHENETPVLGEQIKNIHLVYDLVYNPFETRFLREAKTVGVPTVGGLAMLIFQAAAQFKIWTNLDAPIEEIGEIAFRKLQSQ